MQAKLERILGLLSRNKETILSATRHTLTAVGGALVAQGYVSDGGAEEIVGGLIALIGAVWGALDEHVAEHAPKPIPATLCETQGVPHPGVQLSSGADTPPPARYASSPATSNTTENEASHSIT